jgi:diguanylate cyclase
VRKPAHEQWSAVAYAYAVVPSVLIAAYPWLPATLRMLAFLVVSFATLPAAFIGLFRTPTTERGPWWLLVAALVSLNAGNVAWYAVVLTRHVPSADGSIATLFSTLGLVFILASALTLVVRRGRDDTGGLIDAAIVAMAAGGLLWDVLILPHMQAVHARTVNQVSMCVVVFVLSGVLGALIRLLQTARRFIPALWLLATGLAASLTGNVALAVLADPVTRARPAWTDMVFMAAYAALGLFGIERSATALLRPGPMPADRLSTGRLVFLGIALAAVPVVGGGRQVFGQQVDGLLLTIGAVAVTPLVMTRIGGLYAQRARAEKALLHQATHDPLTGLPNRREFTARLLHAAQGGRELVVLFCDLDGFKEINDQYGHLAGDQVLIEVAARLRRCMRENDELCRYGGDEFLILCTDATQDAAAELCRRIADALEPFVHAYGEPIVVGASVGAVIGTGGDDPEELIHRADEAMYAAKQNRRRLRNERRLFTS